MVYYSNFFVPLVKRTFFIAKYGDAVCELSFSNDEKRFIEGLKKRFGDGISNSGPELNKEINQILEYFRGKREKFNIKFSLQGTKFQKKVWLEMLKIPYGKTISYWELAKKIKNENALRAVGTACGKNPVPVIIPCHRVISKDGSLGGFGGGLELKSKMLELESMNS